MKKGIFLFLVFVSATTINAQSLRDALFGGKLKTDSGTVIRKTDDLSTKIDTTRKKPIEPEKPKASVIVGNSSTVVLTIPTDTSSVNQNFTKENKKTWDEFVAAVEEALKTEVLNSKKIKKGDYSVMVDYVIEMDGKISITNVFVTPESKFLQEQVKERLSIDTPTLNPVLGSNGKPRKANKRVSFNLSKS